MYINLMSDLSEECTTDDFEESESDMDSETKNLILEIEKRQKEMDTLLDMQSIENKKILDALKEDQLVIAKEIEDCRKQIETNIWRAETYVEKHLYLVNLHTPLAVADYNCIGLKHLDPQKLQLVWDTICSKALIPATKTQLYHPFINICIDSVFSEFDISSTLHTQSNYQTAVHDFQSKTSTFFICPRNIKTPTKWSNLGILGFVENMNNFDDMAGRVIDFGRGALLSASGTCGKIVRFSATTDGRCIRFFVFVSEKGTKMTYYTNFLEFWPKKRQSECSDGIKVLCQLVNLISEQANYLPSKIKIGSNEYSINSIIDRNLSASTVCTIDLDGSECAVKYSEDGGLKNYSLTREFEIYKSLQQSKVRLIKLHSYSNDQMIIFEEIGINLKSWSSKLLFPDVGVSSVKDKKLFLSVMRTVLEEVIKLHRFGYTHGDIRPDNILILKEDKACLIDFDCSNHHEVRMHSPHGTAMFVSTRFVTEPPRFYLRSYDLESFYISFLDCIAPDLFQMILKSYTFKTSKDCDISSDFVNYRNEIFHELSSCESPTKLAQTKYHSDLLVMFSKMFSEINQKSLTDDLNIESIYGKINEILTMK